MQDEEKEKTYDDKTKNYKLINKNKHTHKENTLK